MARGWQGAPLFWLWCDVQTMLVFQAGLPIYAQLRDYAYWLALAIPVSFFMNPCVHRTNVQGFHTMLLAVPMVSLAVNAVVRQSRNLASTTNNCTTTTGFLLLGQEEAWSV